MATYADVIKRALTKVGIREAESPVTASELQDGLDQLNDMLSLWENSGIQLGFTPSLITTDELRVPRFSLGAIKANLAVFMAPEYGRQVSQALAAEAVSTKNDLLVAIIDIGDVNFPGTLPIGSGNQCADFDLDRRYFHEDQKVNF